VACEVTEVKIEQYRKSMILEIE